MSTNERLLEEARNLLLEVMHTQPISIDMRRHIFNHLEKKEVPAVTPGITTERDVRNTVTPGAQETPWSDPDEVGHAPAPAQGDTPRMTAFLNGRLPCSTLESALIEQGIKLERELAEAKGGRSADREQWAHLERNVKACEAEIRTLRQQLDAATKERDEARQWLAERPSTELYDRAVARNAELMSELAALRLDRERLAKDYHELLFAVARKHENETRHQTALRYIRQTEANCCSGPAIDSAMKQEGRG